jgi:hypothetical protein
VYLTFPLLIALFALDARLKISTRGHQLMQIGILLFVYGLVHLWLKANSSALLQMDQEQYRGRITVIQIPPYQRSDTDKGQYAMLQLPDSQMKGVLDDTYQVDYINAESFSSDEISQELDKE